MYVIKDPDTWSGIAEELKRHKTVSVRPTQSDPAPEDMMSKIKWAADTFGVGLPVSKMRYLGEDPTNKHLYGNYRIFTIEPHVTLESLTSNANMKHLLETDY